MSSKSWGDSWSMSISVRRFQRPTFGQIVPSGPTVTLHVLGTIHLPEMPSESNTTLTSLKIFHDFPVISGALLEHWPELTRGIVPGFQASTGNGAKWVAGSGWRSKTADFLNQLEAKRGPQLIPSPISTTQLGPLNMFISPTKPMVSGVFNIFQYQGERIHIHGLGKHPN